MLYELLKIIVLVFGTLAMYTAVISVLQIPEVITSLPAKARHTIEVVGALFIIGAWLISPGEALTGAMALIGLMLLLTPTSARKLSLVYAD